MNEYPIWLPDQKCKTTMQGLYEHHMSLPSIQPIIVNIAMKLILINLSLNECGTICYDLF